MMNSVGNKTKRIAALGLSILTFASYSVCASADAAFTSAVPSTIGSAEQIDANFILCFTPNVTGLKLNSATANTLTVSWDSAASASGYEVSVQKGNNRYVYATYGAKTTSCTINKYGSSNLSANTTYKVIVRAKSSFFASPVWGEEARANYKTSANVNVTLNTTSLNQRYGGYGFGCGGTSLTMIMNSEKNRNYNKADVLANQFRHGWYVGNIRDNFRTGYGKSGSNSANLKNLARFYGFSASSYCYPTKANYTNISDTNITNKIKNNLLAGHRMICGVNYSGANHWVVIYGCYTQGNTTYYRIADPWGSNTWSAIGAYSTWSEANLLRYMHNVDMSGVNALIWLA